MSRATVGRSVNRRKPVYREALYNWPVRYHGSLIDRHGQYEALGPNEYGRYLLRPHRDNPNDETLYNVRRESFERYPHSTLD